MSRKGGLKILHCECPRVLCILLPDKFRQLLRGHRYLVKTKIYSRLRTKNYFLQGTAEAMGQMTVLSSVAAKVG